MKKALVGYTGFVGSNIYAAGGYDGAYNSKNIEEAFGTKPDLLIYSGLRAEKYLANNDPERDLRSDLFFGKPQNGIYFFGQKHDDHGYQRNQPV